jgi:hypothetical protein
MAPLHLLENQKTPEKFIGGPVGWKNMGPLPHIFPPPPRAAFLARLLPCHNPALL